MPQLIFKGVELETIKEISKPLVDELSLITDSPRDYFTLEYIDSKFIFDGQETPLYPLIEVKWFDRGQSCKDRVASAIKKSLKYKEYELIEVFFTPIEEEDYY